MTRIVEVYYCSKHPGVTIGQAREYDVFTGVHDNGEDYVTETDYDFWPCRKCKEEDILS